MKRYCELREALHDAGAALPPRLCCLPDACCDASPPPPPFRQGLSKLLADNAPNCIREQKFENYFGRKIAVDASMHIYSFLVG